MSKAVIENTEVFEIKSKIVDDIFQITIMKPEIDSKELLPVVYLTDANTSAGTSSCIG